MPSNICSMTGQLIKEAAVSKKTGHIYEKSAIIKHLSSFPYCPKTNTPMQISDLVFIEASNTALVRPQQSINSVLNNLKAQYDTIVLQNFYLKKSIIETKQQLFNSVTVNEAAQKVIGKLLQEKQQVDRQVQKLRKEVSA